MSTKTNFKRVALVAVASLGIGVLTSIAPANAVDAVAGDLVLTSSAAGVANSGLCTTLDATTAALARTIAVGGSQQFTHATSDTGRAVISGNASWAAGATAGTVGSTGKTLSFTTTSSTLGVMSVTGTGVITVDVYATATSTSSLKTLYFVGVTSCTSGASVAKSFVQLSSSSTKIMTNANFAAGTAIGSATTNAAGAMDNSNDNDTSFANAATAYIHINTNDAYGVAYTTSSTLAVSCTNNATVGGLKGGYYAAGSQTAGYYDIAVAQPTSGTALKTTCTVSLNGTVLGTKSLTIVGDLASIEASLNTNGDTEGTTTASYGTIKYSYKDAAGNTLTATGNLPALTSSTITSKTNALITTDGSTAGGTTVRDAKGVAAGAAAQSGRVAYNCIDFGVSPVSIYAVNASVAVITSNVVSVVCGGPTFTYTAALDKASYQTGDVATLTITAKSYNGDAVASNVTLGTGAAVALGGMTSAGTIATTDALSDNLKGTWTYTFTVGQTAGSYSGSVKIALDSAYATLSPQYGKATTVSYKITDNSSGVSNADVLKAIVSLIASINKQIAALQKALLKK
jgi:hypothetical protein